jgi:hypothetical protein
VNECKPLPPTAGLHGCHAMRSKESDSSSVRAPRRAEASAASRQGHASVARRVIDTHFEHSFCSVPRERGTWGRSWCNNWGCRAEEKRCRVGRYARGSCTVQRERQSLGEVRGITPQQSMWHPMTWRAISASGSHLAPGVPRAHHDDVEVGRVLVQVVRGDSPRVGAAL